MSFVKCDTLELSYQDKTMQMFLHIILIGKLFLKQECSMAQCTLRSSRITDQAHCGEARGLESDPSDLTAGNSGKGASKLILPVKLRLSSLQ